MKRWILAVAVFAAFSARANTVETVFQKDSPLPKELRELVLDAVNARCARGVSWNGLKEISTKVTPVEIEQGQVDNYYDTEFKSDYIFDGAHPTFAYITVRSAAYDTSFEPDMEPYEIFSVESDSQVCK